MDCIEQALKKAGTLRRRTRRLLAFAVVTAAMGQQYASGQTFAEWFSQKKTQRKYLIEQIAALNMYRMKAVKGYNIAKGGLGSISNYLGNEYALHQQYYTHLRQVSPAVKNNPQVREILNWQREIVITTGGIRKTAGLTQGERSYVDRVCSAVLKHCEVRLTDLQDVMENSKTAMSDEQRLRQVSRLHQAMQDNYRFTAYLSSQLLIYVRERRNASRDIHSLKNLYEK